MGHSRTRTGVALCALALLALLAACDVTTISAGGATSPPDGSPTVGAAHGIPATATPAGSVARAPAASPAAPTVAPTATPTGGTIDGSAITNLDYDVRVIARTNMYRARFGCPALTPNGILMGTALAHSADMALHHFFAHTSSDGTSPWTRIKAGGYDWLIVAENIASATQSPEQVVDGWFAETPPNDAHRANILNCKLRDVGVGYYTIWDPTWHTDHPYWTEDFGTPLN